MQMLMKLLWLVLCTTALDTLAEGPNDGAVFVTRYLPDRVQDGQAATVVDLSSLGWKTENAMYSGYITIDNEKKKNTFFWLSTALDGNSSAPLLLWLQGGPGASSLFGMFTEIGPFGIAPGGVIEPRAVNWNQHYHLLFLDNPVGTGFSFTETEEGFVSRHEQAGEDLQEAMSQFFQLFPQFRGNDFYVTGESYAGKWVPSCAYAIHEKNKDLPHEQRINLKGIAIGDGAMNPAEQFKGFGDLLWFTGMVDEVERAQFQTYERGIQEAVKAGDTIGAFEIFDEMLNGDFYPYPTYYANVTGMGSNYFNFELSPDATPLGGDFVQWLNQDAVKARIHVGSRNYVPANNTVEAHLKSDWMRDVLAELVPLMENYKVMIYNGQNDIILGPTLTENFLLGLAWSGQEEYSRARKSVWRRSSKGPGSELPDVAGYARQVGQFVQVVVRGGGHMVPGDQPERALDMLERFVSGAGFGVPAMDIPTASRAFVV